MLAAVVTRQSAGAAETVGAAVVGAGAAVAAAGTYVARADAGSASAGVGAGAAGAGAGAGAGGVSPVVPFPRCLRRTHAHTKKKTEKFPSAAKQVSNVQRGSVKSLFFVYFSLLQSASDETTRSCFACPLR